MKRHIKNYWLLAILSCILLVTDCKKETGNSNPGIINFGNTIKSKIVLPNGSSLNLAAATVLSLIEAAPVVDSMVTLHDSSHKYYATQLLTNPNGDILMMGFDYPGAPSKDITVQSTALALVMNMPIVLSITNEGKSQLISELSGNQSFANVSQAVGNAIQSGKTINDTTNMELIGAIASFFDSTNTQIFGTISRAIHRNGTTTNGGGRTYGTLGTLDQPVIVNQGGRLIKFVNNGTVVTYQIGIYLNGQRVYYEPLAAVNFVPTSLAGIFNSLFNSPGQSENDFTMKGDGDFKVVIRSGQTLDGTNESSDARKANINNAVQLTLSGFLNALPINDCLKAWAKKLAENATIFIYKGSYNSAEFSGAAKDGVLVCEATYALINSSIEIVKGCLPTAEIPDAIVNFLKSAGKLVNLAKAVLKYPGIVGSIVATSVLVYQFATLPPNIDLCYTAKGNSVSYCDAGWVGTWSGIQHFLTYTGSGFPQPCTCDGPDSSYVGHDFSFGFTIGFDSANVLVCSAFLVGSTVCDSIENGVSITGNFTGNQFQYNYNVTLCHTLFFNAGFWALSETDNLSLSADGKTITGSFNGTKTTGNDPTIEEENVSYSGTYLLQKQ